MRLNAAGIQLEQQSEGCRLTAYPDINDIPTIGWGSIYITSNGKLRRVVMGDTITQAQADAMWLEKENENEGYLNAMLKSPVNDNQYGAIMDFMYQFGPGNLKASTLLRLINTDPKDTITQAFIATLKVYVARAATTTLETEAQFLQDWAKEMENCPTTSIAYQFLRWVHGAHGEIVFGILVRAMKNILLYNS